MTRYRSCSVLTLWIVLMLNNTIAPFAATNNHFDNNYVIILAGGSGQRLWPFSKEATPKQLLSIDDNQTLLEQSIERANKLVPSPANIWIVTTNAHEAKIREHVGNTVGKIIVEPIARNTGPAIAYCCLMLQQENPQAHVIFTPADAYIPNNQTIDFVASAQKALACSAHHDGICLLGIAPTFASTGYGYIEYEKQKNYVEGHKVHRFHEKPALEIAEGYLAQGSMLWNTCIFAGNVSRFIAEFEEHAPEVMSATRNFCNQTDYYETIPSISVDCAIIEKSKNIWVVPCTYSWHDVGNVTTFLSLKQQNTTSFSNHLLINSHNNLIDVPNKLVALIDIDDLCIIQTADALLITKKDSAEKVRTLVSSLKKQNLNHYL